MSEEEPEVLFDFTEQPIPQDSFEGLMDFYKENPKLNLGCGEDIREGYVNIDLVPWDGLTLRADVRNMPFFPSNVAEQILAYDVLEHFSYHHTKKVLSEWIRLLKPEGEFIVRVPDMAKIAKALLDKELPAFEASRLLYGGQDYGLNYHMAGFTAGLLEGLVLGCGCREIVQVVTEDDSHNITVVAKK